SCTGPGNVVNGSITITNPGVSTAVVASVALPAMLVGLTGSCTASVGTCTVAATTVSYNSTIPAGQTATISYQAQVGDVTANTQLCSTLTATFNAGPVLTTQACVTVNCPAVGPGLFFPSTGEVSDQKAGSVLVYNLYSSSIAAHSAEYARLEHNNTHPGVYIAVHQYFEVGESDAFLA